jgi:hypothetical protein
MISAGIGGLVTMPHYGSRYLSGAFLSFLTGRVGRSGMWEGGGNATTTPDPKAKCNTETRSKWPGTQGSCIPRYSKVISYGT